MKKREKKQAKKLEKRERAKLLTQGGECIQQSQPVQLIYFTAGITGGLPGAGRTYYTSVLSPVPSLMAPYRLSVDFRSSYC